MIDRLMIALQDDPNVTVGYDSDEDVDGLRAAHKLNPCRECKNGACWVVEPHILPFYCFRVIVVDYGGNVGTEGGWWPKWDMESCPYQLADQ